MDRCVTQDQRLEVGFLDLRDSPEIVPTVQKLGEEDAEREVYRLLATTLMAQGLRRGKGLQKQMARYLGESETAVSKKAKGYLTDLAKRILLRLSPPRRRPTPVSAASSTEPLILFVPSQS